MDLDFRQLRYRADQISGRTGGHGNIEHSAKKKLMVKFTRDEVAAVLETGECVPVKVSGYVGEFAFEAFDNIKVG